MNEFDFDFLSLALATVGLFFICCAVVQKKPKHILEEAFGLYKGGLRDLKSSVFKRNQVVMGYLCVVLAIVLNIVSVHAAPQAEGIVSRLDTVPLIACLIAFMTALSGILNYLSRIWSKAAFRRLVHEVVTEARWPFEENMALTKEIGKLLGVPAGEHDTVEVYISRIRHHLKIPVQKPNLPANKRRATRLG